MKQIFCISKILLIFFTLASTFFFPSNVFADSTYSNGSYGDCLYSSNCPVAPTPQPSPPSKPTSNNSTSTSSTSTSTPPPVPQTPQSNLIVNSIGGNIISDTNADTIFKTKDTPTANGKAPANSTITVTYSPGNYDCIIYTDISGNWSCTLDKPLKPGIYSVVVTAKTQTGQILSSPTYRIQATHVSLTKQNKKINNLYLIPIIIIIFILVIYLIILLRQRNKSL